MPLKYLIFYNFFVITIIDNSIMQITMQISFPFILIITHEGIQGT